MRTALILAFAANGDVSLLSAPSAPFDEVRARWAQLQALEEHPEGVIRYEFWNQEGAKKFIPGETNSATAATFATTEKARAAEKAKILAARPPAAEQQDPELIKRHAELLRQKNSARGIKEARTAESAIPAPATAAPVPAPATAAWDQVRAEGAATAEPVPAAAEVPAVGTPEKKKKK